MKYFGACTVPGDAKDLAFKLWKPQNWRFLNCTDDEKSMTFIEKSQNFIER